MNLSQFKSYIKTVSNEEFDSLFDEISGLHGRARKLDIIAGYAIALDELVLEKSFRSAGYGVITQDELDAIANMSDDELLAELGV